MASINNSTNNQHDFSLAEHSSLIALQELQNLESERIAEERSARAAREAAEAQVRAEREARARAEREAEERARRELEAQERARQQQLAQEERVRLAEVEARARQEESIRLAEIQARIDGDLQAARRRQQTRGVMTVLGTLTGCLVIGGLAISFLGQLSAPETSSVAPDNSAEVRALAAEAAALRGDLDRLRGEHGDRKEALSAFEREQAAAQRRAEEEARANAEASKPKGPKRPRNNKNEKPEKKKPGRVKICNTDNPLAGIADDDC